MVDVYNEFNIQKLNSILKLVIYPIFRNYKANIKHFRKKFINLHYLKFFVVTKNILI